MPEQSFILARDLRQANPSVFAADIHQLVLKRSGTNERRTVDAIRTFSLDHSACRHCQPIRNADFRVLGSGTAFGSDPAEYAGSTFPAGPGLHQAGLALSESNRPLRASTCRCSESREYSTD